MQYVEINGKRSQIRSVKLGVAQGCILGPLLFTMYIDDLPRSLDSSQILVYTDDITLYFSAGNSQDLNDVLEDDVDRVTEWLNKIRLCLNIKKIKLLLIGSSQRLPVFRDVQITLQWKFIYLGVLLDEKLSWIPHLHGTFKRLCISSAYLTVFQDF